QYIDTAMVGSLGPVATAAVAVNTSTIWLVNGVMYSFGAAYSVVIARYIGAQESDNIQKSVKQAFLAMISLSLIITLVMSIVSRHLAIWLGVEQKVVSDAVDYMKIIAISYPFFITFIFLSNMIRSSGDTKTPLISNIVTNLFNITGNFLLIFPTREITFLSREFTVYGAGLGVKGAAIATLISHILSASILLTIVLTKDSPLKISLKKFSWRFDPIISHQVLRVGLPMALERITLSSGQIVLTSLVTNLGTVSLAAHHLAITAESITFMPVSGFSLASATLVAQALGAKKREMAKDFARRTLIGGIVLMSVTGTGMYLAAVQLMSFFTQDIEVITLGARVLRIEAFAQPFFAMSIVIGGILRGAGDTKWPFIFSIIGMWFVRLLPAFVLITFFNGTLIVGWVCMVADLVVRGSLNFHRYRSGKWLDVWVNPEKDR
ncbi:MAG: MATE family efflux transporter, partial [Sphaerochaetaceae bacterium]